MKSMKQIILDAYRDTACDHPHPKYVKGCRQCIANQIDREARFYFAQELRLVIEIALDGLDDDGKVKNSDYFQGWRDAIAHLDPSGQQFLDIVADSFIGKETTN